MTFTLATWNINSVRLREALVSRLLTEETPDVLCLQECKSPVELIPMDQFRALGYRYMVARGQKGYNGVAILSKLPITDAGDKDFAQLGHARHV
ncbi:MAG: endonuclease/exonuclease/phosphatase family protein, partial [Tabrizicola sp.]|uniref:endonuclease/exonuclease/phosphatase family protein n=1 Tax=Tabrizicola sp. TaxID=2005166 RepID=UPI003BB1F642